MAIHVSTLVPAQMQAEVFLVPSMPGLLAIGFIISIVLLLLVIREKKDPLRKRKLTSWGLSLLGFMIFVTPFTVYGYLAVVDRMVVMTFADVVILALVSFVGGMTFIWGIDVSRRPVVGHQKR